MCCSLEKGIEAGRATEWYTSDTIVTTQHRGSHPQTVYSSIGQDVSLSRIKGEFDSRIDYIEERSARLNR
jgi:hypothetical protein